MPPYIIYFDAQEGQSALDVAAACQDLNIYPYLRSMITNGRDLTHQSDPSIGQSTDQDAADDNSSDTSSSSATSAFQTSYISSMEVKKLRKNKDGKKKSKNVYRESLCESINLDGEESIDDDNSPRKTKKVMYSSKLNSEQLLSPLSQSSTETTYSSIVESDSRVKVTISTSVASRINQEMGANDTIKEEETEKEAAAIAEDEVIEEIDVRNVLISGKQPLEENLTEQKVAFLECQSPTKISSSSSNSSFVTAKSTAKSPFKKMRKAAGRAFSFVARGGEKKVKSSKHLKTKS